MANKVIRYMKAGTTATEYTYILDTGAAIDTLWSALTPSSPTISGVTVQYAERYDTSFSQDSNTGVIKVAGTPDATFGNLPGAGFGTPNSTTQLVLANGANNNLTINANFGRISGPSGAFSVTGIGGGYDGAVTKLYNTTSQVMTVPNNSGSSTAGNKILTGQGDMTVAGVGTVTLTYSASDAAWIVTGISEATTSGTTAVANGGTGVATMTAHGVVIGEGTSAVAITAAGTTGQVLTGVTGADPVFSSTTPTPVIQSAASGAIAIPALSPAQLIITYNGGAGAYTLAAPTAGGPGTGQDGQRLVLITTTAQAHVVTSGVDGFNAKGSSGTLTFTATIGNACELIAYNGHWYAITKTGVTVA